MLNIQDLKIVPFAKKLTDYYELTFGSYKQEVSETIHWAAHLALENIANCDMLYHNLDHTIMVTMAGQEIFRGKQLNEGKLGPNDWLTFTLGTLFHDIGYVKGVCSEDRYGLYDDGNGELIALPEHGTSAVLTPYHVDRSKMFVEQRFGGHPVIDCKTIMDCIEMTRFPVPNRNTHKQTSNLPGLTRAADFIGQLGDPNYLLKIPALYYEFEEIGCNEALGYKTPGDFRKSYANFFWNVVRPYIESAIHYLKVTQEGKQWISNLHSHVFESEHSYESIMNEQMPENIQAGEQK
jgi:hypothetical protein|tara:strand:- start:1165 stop:2043 length:879 start_codon:yes stop_codon:yes gene_type:complete